MQRARLQRRMRRIFLCVFVIAAEANAPAESPADTGVLAWRDLARPEPLTVLEEASHDVATLAHRYNPAMAFPTRDVWPTSVSYAWHDGSNLIGRIVAKTGRVVREFVALRHQALDRDAWDHLPTQDNQGNRIEYYVDAPGDDRLIGQSTAWLERWRAIMNPYDQARPVTMATYPPTQYAHLFWYNRAAGLLAIQYWFYYPYDEWINHHEGDWEHINVILHGPNHLTTGADFGPVAYQFFFHGFSYEPEQVITVSGTDPRESHVLVFAGGKSRFLGWSGTFSGGSYPLPAVYRRAGGGWKHFRPDEDTRNPQRYVASHEFRVIVLPEPERLDTRAQPELSWLKLPFFAGQPVVYRNPFVVAWFERGGVPQQPGLRRDWNARHLQRAWRGQPDRPQTVRLPNGWPRARLALVNPPSQVLARR